jgi:hypothetical protein
MEFRLEPSASRRLSGINVLFKPYNIGILIPLCLGSPWGYIQEYQQFLPRSQPIQGARYGTDPLPK